VPQECVQLLSRGYLITVDNTYLFTCFQNIAGSPELSGITNSASFMTSVICYSVFFVLSLTLFVLHLEAIDLLAINVNHSRKFNQCMNACYNKVKTESLLDWQLLQWWSGNLSTSNLCPLKPEAGRQKQVLQITRMCLYSCLIFPAYKAHASY
jgi:hypothetical protein